MGGRSGDRLPRAPARRVPRVTACDGRAVLGRALQREIAEGKKARIAHEKRVDELKAQLHDLKVAKPGAPPPARSRTRCTAQCVGSALLCVRGCVGHERGLGDGRGDAPDRLTPAYRCTGAGLAAATSAPGLALQARLAESDAALDAAKRESARLADAVKKADAKAEALGKKVAESRAKVLPFSRLRPMSLLLSLCPALALLPRPPRTKAQRAKAQASAFGLGLHERRHGPFAPRCYMPFASQTEEATNEWTKELRRAEAAERARDVAEVRPRLPSRPAVLFPPRPFSTGSRGRAMPCVAPTRRRASGRAERR